MGRQKTDVFLTVLWGKLWGEEESKSTPDILFYPQWCSPGLRNSFPKLLWMQELWCSPTEDKRHPCRWRWYKTHCKAKARFKPGQGFWILCISHGRYEAKCSGSVDREEIIPAVILPWNSAQKLMGKQHLPKSALKTPQDAHRKTTLLDAGIYFYCCCFTGHLPEQGFAWARGVRTVTADLGPT